MDKAIDYDELAMRAERGEFDIVPGTVLTGEAAAAEGRRLMGVSTED